MKVYKCDACGCVITDPYKVKMKEFYIGTVSSLIAYCPNSDIQKIKKIHLCEECFKGLHLVAKKSFKEQNIKKPPTADVEPVVRCKNCIHHNNCEIEIAGMFGDNSFCVCGEKKGRRRK